MKTTGITRRELIQTTCSVAAGLAVTSPMQLLADEMNGALITRTVPSSGEQLPVVGVGTNQFGTDDPETLVRIKQLLDELPGLGGTVVDTALMYGNSEEVIGKVVEANGNRDELFIATKAAGRGAVSEADIHAAFDRLRMETIDLFQVHNFNETENVLGLLDHLKKEGRTRYVGCSTSRDSQYEQLVSAMNDHPLDFIQVDYSIDNRSAADVVLPMAADKGVAVLINMPFGGRRNAASIFGKVSGKDLPDWAAEIDVSSWAQFFLKYVVSHPAVTTAIPGTTKPHYMVDNMMAAHGRLPDGEMRKEMERFWAELA